MQLPPELAGIPGPTDALKQPLDTERPRYGGESPKGGAVAGPTVTRPSERRLGFLFRLEPVAMCGKIQRDERFRI